MKPSTLDDLEGEWQPVRSAILATARLLVIQPLNVNRSLKPIQFDLLLISLSRPSQSTQQHNRVFTFILNSILKSITSIMYYICIKLWAYNSKIPFTASGMDCNADIY